MILHKPEGLMQGQDYMCLCQCVYVYIESGIASGKIKSVPISLQIKY